MLRTIGLMSGTSLDGVDAAYLEPDGERVFRLGPSVTLPYHPSLRRELRRLLDAAPELPPDSFMVREAEARLTERHIEAVMEIGLPADLKAGIGTGGTIQRGIGSPQERWIQPHRWAAGAGSDPQTSEGALAGRNPCGGLATDRQIPTP